MTPWATFGIGLVACIAGVAVAVLWTHDSADAGRGGAVAVALSFFILFQNHDSARTSYNDEKSDLATRSHNALGALLDISDKQRLPLTLTSVLGTLVWGFADILARWICPACA